MHDQRREFVYRPTWWGIVLFGIFCALCLIVFVRTALTIKRGLILFHYIRFEAETAPWFFWFLAAVSTCGVLFAAFLGWHRTTTYQRIVLGANSLIVPSSRWSRLEKTIAYDAVTGVATTTFNGRRILRIYHSDGRFTVGEYMLPDHLAFDEIYNEVSSKVRATVTKSPNLG